MLAGLLGALTGLGGGVVLVPVLALGFGVDIHYAMGASLVSVIATSSGAAAAYVKEGYTNIRIGMLLEIATTLGAVAGAFLATGASTRTIAIVFGVVLLYSAAQSIKEPDKGRGDTSKPDPLATRLKLNGYYPVGARQQHYFVRNVPGGFSIMFGAGVLSGLLGIGSGAVKVLAMDRAMRIPFQGFDNDQQLHDWGYRSRQRRRLSQPWFYSSGIDDAGNAGRSDRRICRQQAAHTR